MEQPFQKVIEYTFTFVKFVEYIVMDHSINIWDIATQSTTAAFQYYRETSYEPSSNLQEPLSTKFTYLSMSFIISALPCTSNSAGQRKTEWHANFCKMCACKVKSRSFDGAPI